MKKALILFSVLVLAAVKVHAAQGESDAPATPVWNDYGNTQRNLTTPTNATNIVLISSAAPAATRISSGMVSNLGIANWRRREIYNTSTGCVMGLYFSSEYNVFSATSSVLVSSPTAIGAGLATPYVTFSQSPIWAIWFPAGTAGNSCVSTHGGGALVVESYYRDDQRR